MTTEAQILGKHLKQIRISKGMSQGEVARKLDVSRSTLAQMELGNRLVRVEDITALATIYDCSPASLMSSAGKEPAGSVPVQISDEIVECIPLIKRTKETISQLRRAIDIAMALTDMEEKLGLRVCSLHPPDYNVTSPASPWEATHQGYVVAEQERLRLNLGDVPVRDVSETLAIVGIRTTGIDMPAEISSLFIQTVETGTLVIVNNLLSPEMRRLKYAHGYAHCLFDRNRRWIVCRPDSSDSFEELRASAFAGRFLVPETGLRRYIQSLGKDTMSQSTGSMLSVYTEDVGQRPSKQKDLSVDGRDRRGMNPVSFCDVTQVAHYFGVDLKLTAHMMANLRYLDKRELQKIVSANRNAVKMLEALGLRSIEKNQQRDSFHSRFIALSLEGLVRGIIDLDYFNRIIELLEISEIEKKILLKNIGYDTSSHVSPTMPSIA